MKPLALLFSASLLPAHLAAQTPDFSGSFSAPGQNGTVVVTLVNAGNGQYTGTMSNGSLTWQLRGDRYEDALTGTISTGQGVFAFEAHLADPQLQLILVEVGADGVPRTDQGQELTFTRVADSTANPQGPPAPAGGALSDLVRGGGPAPASDPFLGSFSDGQFTLSLQASDDGYAGRLALGAEAYPVAARRSGDHLEGRMTAPTGQYDVIISASADGVVLSNAGTDYALRRVAGQQSGVGASAAPAGPAQPASPADDSPLAQQWRAYLAGKKVTYISSYSSNTPGGGGLSTKLVYHLCSDGRFAYSGSDVVSHNLPGAGVPGGGSAGSASGTWRIVTQGQLAGIELRFANGQTETYRLDMQGNQTFANGERVYVTPGEVCR